MSVPHFILHNSQRIEINPQACWALFEFLQPKLEEIDEDFAAFFEVLFDTWQWDIAEFPDDYYMQAYHWIIEACDSIDSLTPYKDALNKALRADPRFQHK